MCVYRSMLSNVIGPIDGFRVGEHPRVTRLIKGVFNSRPPKKSLVPEWDLHLVLRVLREGPFEPMGTAHPKCVTFKFAFLLAVTTSRRVSDLSHLAIGDHCRVQEDRVTFLPTKLGKSDDPGHFMQPITVPAFPRDDKVCVVRAMKHYLRLTEDRRGTNNPKALLRSMVKPFGPPSPQTISNWIVRAIHMAYDIAKKQTKGKVKAHSTRALGPSWAGMKGASLAQILDAADWRRKSTFCRFYLRDMSSEQTAFGRAVLSAADVPEPKL